MIVKKGKPSKSTSNKLKFEDVKVGEKVVFNNGKEKLTLKVMAIHPQKRQMDVRWGTIDTYIFKRDFEEGSVKKARTAVKQKIKKVNGKKDPNKKS